MSAHCPQCHWRDENWHGSTTGLRCPDCGYVFCGGTTKDDSLSGDVDTIDLGDGWTLTWGDVIRSSWGPTATLYPTYQGTGLWSDRVPLVFVTSRQKFAARLKGWAEAEHLPVPDQGAVAEALVRLHQRLSTPPPPPPVESAEDRAARLERLHDSAVTVFSSSDPLRLVAEVLTASGFAGDDTAAHLLYLAATARLLPRPVSVLLSGPSAGGKSHLLTSVLSLFPDSAYYWLTGMSRKAIQHEREDAFVHRIVCTAEAPALRGGDVTTLRELVWGGQLVFRSATGPRGATETTVLRGPAALCTTPTRAIDYELATRVLEIPVADDPGATRAVLLATAETAAGRGGNTGGVLDTLRAAQEWLATQDWRTVVPFAPALAAAYPAGSVRARRDFAHTTRRPTAQRLCGLLQRDLAAGGRLPAPSHLATPAAE